MECTWSLISNQLLPQANTNNKLLRDTKLFEKIELKWMTSNDMKKRLFRPIYREIVKQILSDLPLIFQSFLNQKQKKGKHWNIVAFQTLLREKGMRVYSIYSSSS